MIKSSERSRKDEVINVLDTGDSNRGNNSQEFTISKFNSATQVHIKPLYEIFHLGKSFLGWVGHLRSTWSLGATLPRAESTLDSSPTSIVPSLRTFNANACPLLCNKHVVWAHLFESYVENTVLKKSRILSSESSCAIICLSCSFYNGAKLSSDIKLAPVDQDFTSSEAAVNCAGAAAGWWCHLQKTCQHTSLATTGQRPFKEADLVTDNQILPVLSFDHSLPVHRLRLNCQRWLVKGVGRKVLWESCCAVLQAAWATKPQSRPHLTWLGFSLPTALRQIFANTENF